MILEGSSTPVKYVFTDLKNLTEGRHNIVAIVKYFQPAKKTRGSGFSMFISISDPSLGGDKFPVTIINNSLEKLPQIKSPGDVLIMHRLNVSTFHGRLQGCGSDIYGFAMALFPGEIDAPLEPYSPHTNCSYTTADLIKVKDLRNWYHSPDCQLEKEVAPNVSNSLQVGNFNACRIQDAKLNTFLNVDAQVVGVYTYPPEVTADLILCLWDGEPSATAVPNQLPFFTPFDLDRPPSPSNALIDPRLASVCNCFSIVKDLPDWSVCVFVFDEHAECARTLKPGDLVRIHNLRCNSRADKRKLDLHGGGHRYGRKIEVLSSESASPDLLERLNSGRLQRQPLNASSIPQDPNSPEPISIAKFCETFEQPKDSPSRVRICGRLVDVAPSEPKNLTSYLYLCCRRCKKRAACKCGSNADLSTLPSFLLELNDSTGRLSVTVSTRGIQSLIGESNVDDFRSALRTVALEPDPRTRHEAAEEIVSLWRACIGQWIDAPLLVQQRTKLVYLDAA